MLDLTSVSPVLSYVATKFLDSLFGNISNTLLNKLKSDQTKVALRVALGAAIQRYSTERNRLALSLPLMDRKNSPLTKKEVVTELSQIVRFRREPDATLIGEHWKKALEDPPSWCDFTQESKVLINYLIDELRTSEVFQPVFEAKSLDAIADATSSSQAALTTIESQLAHILDLLQGHLGPLMKRFNGAELDIRNHIRDFSRLIKDKTYGFVGRKFVFDAIDQFLEENHRGYFLVYGDPGIGKTALAAQLVKKGGYAHHFNIRTEGINTPRAFLQNICAQLIASYRLPHNCLPPDATQDTGFFSQLLDEISAGLAPHEKVVIVVDALDEVDYANQPAGSNILFLPNTLPPSVYIIATTQRKEHDLYIKCEHGALYIEQDSKGNIFDIREYITNAVKEPSIQHYISSQGITSQYFVDHMEKRSQGNFMYLHYVLPEIANGAYKTLDLKHIPSGLTAYYQDHWRRMKDQNVEQWFTYKIPIIMALTMALMPVSIDLISHFSGVKEKTRIVAVIQEWQRFLYEETVPYKGTQQKRYRVYHASFNDFIAQMEQVKQERLSRLEANDKIVDYYLKTRPWEDS